MVAKRALLTVAVVLAAPIPAAAEGDVPTAAEIKRVLDYEQHGKDKGPILIELVACSKVDLTKGSPTYYSCLEPIKGRVKKDTVVSAWMAWLCPKGGAYDDITVQFLHQGQVRRTFDLKLEGLSRTRTFRSHPFTKVGAWEIRVARGETELAKVSLTVE